MAFEVDGGHLVSLPAEAAARRAGRCNTTPSNATRSSTPDCTSRSSSGWTRCTASATRLRLRCSPSRSAWGPPGTRRRRGRPAPPPASSCWPPGATGNSARSRTLRGTTAGAATTRPGPRRRRWPRRSARPTSAGCRAAALTRPRSAPPHSTSAATPRRSTGAATGRGMQGGSFDAPKVAATVKHFAGYSESINGHDRVEAQLSVRYLQDTLLPSHAGGIDAGAATVMVNSGSINGVPAHASHFLLTEELRNRLGFRGVVISDYGDVPALASAYHIAARLPPGARTAGNT